MSEIALRESPLVRFDLQGRAPDRPRDQGLWLSERAFLGHLNLRGDPGDAAFLEGARGVLGLDLPVEPNTVAGSGALTACWLGPDEWLLMVPDEAAGGALAGRLREALAGQHASVTEVSGGQTVIVLSGPRVREVLAKGCVIDLHPRVFGVGRCAQTHLAKSPAMIRPVSEEPPRFEVVVRRSFADYLWSWLEDAGREHGVAVLG